MGSLVGSGAGELRGDRGSALLTGQETLTHYIYILTYRVPEITFVTLGALAVYFAIVYATNGRD